MKKTIFFSLVLLCNLVLQARTPEQAAQIAQRFIAPSHSRSVQRAAALRTVDLAYTQYQVDATTPAVYVFNHNDQGFVLVSADENARTILGYADSGHIDAAHMPANLQFWLQMYADELSNTNASASQPSQSKKAIQRTHRITTESNTYPTIQPILANVHWGQNAPYNLYTPTILKKKTPTGCAATAIGQIMYKYQYPKTGIGKYSYVTQTHNISLSADFETTTYDWENILPNYEKNTYTDQQAEAVATLIYHLGIAMDMDYTPSGSGSIPSNVFKALVNHFDYDAAYKILPKDYLLQTDMLSQIANELQQGRPVMIAGHTTNQEGHAFVCDGMQSDGFLHINWGWNGLADGYFALSALAPETHGTGGSSSQLAFTENVTAYIGIQPNKGGKPSAFITVDEIERTSEDTIYTSSNISFNLINFTNYGTEKAIGDITYDIYNDQNQLLQSLPVESIELRPNYYYKVISLYSYDDLALPDGNYQLEITWHDEQGQINRIAVKNQGYVRLPFTIAGNLAIFESEQPTSLHQPLVNAQFIQVANTNQWEVDFSSAAFWNDSVSDTDALLRCTLYSQSNTSVVGTYQFDSTNSGLPGTIGGNAFYAVGYYKSCSKHEPKELYVTITQDNDGKLQLQYYIDYGAEQPLQAISQITPLWYYYDGTNYFYYDNMITYDLAAFIPASSAYRLATTLSESDFTYVSFFVSGAISACYMTPEQIVQQQTASFSITDIDTEDPQLYCHNTRWLNNSAFTTGDEIKPGNQLILYGRLQHYNNHLPSLQGYVYQTTYTDTTDYSIQQLELIRVDGLKATFQWVSNATLVEVSVYDSQSSLLAQSYLSDTEVTLSAPQEDTYSIHVRPVDDQHQYLAPEAVLIVSLFIPVQNLQLQINCDTLLASWQSKAPHFRVVVTTCQGDTIVNLFKDESYFSARFYPDNYTISVQPLDNHLQPLADAIELPFTTHFCPTESSHIAMPVTTTRKTIRNGQLIIIHNGKEYNSMGCRL